MWPDNETTEDLFGFQVHADLIRSVVMNPTMLPTTIGIFGDWGGGKTSIMKMLERDLTPEHWPPGSEERRVCESVAVVYVNTWLFEGYDDAKAAILSSILLELSEHKRFGPKVRDAVLKLMRSVNWMRFAGLTMKHVAIPAATAFLTGGVAAIPTAIAVSVGLSGAHQAKTSNKKHEDEKAPDDPKDLKLSDVIKDKNETKSDSMDVRTFRERFGKMLVDGGINTLVVLVDDLDRCTSDRIIENLEAVKLFLSVERTAFVIGADRRIVEHAIRARYASRAIDNANDEQTRRLIKDYLEKLVQVPYTLPRLSTTEIETYMTLLFCTRYLTETDFATCLKACDDARTANRYASFGYAAVRQAMTNADLGHPLTEALTFAAAAAPLIADGLNGNPRQVKRFLNALLLRKELARVAKLQNIRDSVLTKLMILEYVHTDRFTQLFGWQASENGHPTQLAQLETAIAGPDGNIADEESAKQIDPKWATTSVRKWIAMEPLLNNVDLRDYFWIARDRLESTFAGISMVPPIVRTVLEELLSGSPPKRHAALRSAAKLTADERASLLGLIKQRISRQFDEKNGYDALRFLAEGDVPGAATVLAEVLLSGPLESMPATVGMDLMNLYNARTELQSILDPVKEHLLKSSSKIGKAAQAAKATRK